MRKTSLALLAALSAAFALPAEAQTRRHHHGEPHAGQRAARGWSQVAPNRPAPAAYPPIIRWNTPNADGNFGGPSAGGGGGPTGG